MKIIYKYITVIICISLLISCSKKYEAEPINRITEDLVFDPVDKNADYAQQFLNGTYLLLPDWYNRIDGSFLDAGTDDALPSKDGSSIDNFRNGRISANVLPDNTWSRNYSGIRRANLFLSKIDVVPAPADRKVQWKAEARFLRAYFYFELTKRWGGVPLLGDKVLGLSDQLNYKRNTLQECNAYILSELESIKSSLLPVAITDGDWGRANQGAAMALKARILLYAASPLNNPGNDLQKWSDAAQAAKDLINLNNYALATDFIASLNATRNSEFIFIREQALSQSVENNNGPVGYIVGAGATSPSQNLVDAFLTLNGKNISESGSGYDSSNPYLNRDPRLDATIMYNGKMWLSRPVETFEGGQDKPGGNRIQTKTGYYLRKFMGKFENSASYSNQGHHVILFRYAEILLNYAEALNESIGPVQEVYNSLIAIRKRAGIKAGGDNQYGLPPGASQSAMRTLIRNERRIELAFEEHRFWDLRRWKLAESVLNQPVKGVKITKKQDGSFTYSFFDAAPSVFDASKMYYNPIPYSEILTNPNMVQNPGWSF
jgi:hypothetical protein